MYLGKCITSLIFFLFLPTPVLMVLHVVHVTCVHHVTAGMVALMTAMFVVIIDMVTRDVFLRYDVIQLIW